MSDWNFLNELFKQLQSHSSMLGRFWLLLMLVFRILILGTVASDLFEDEQEEFICNTLQPGCRQVCYDMAFPISQYRFLVFHIVLIATPSLVFLMYAMHHNKKSGSPESQQNSNKEKRQDRRFRGLYIINVAFRMAAEVCFLLGQWWLYGFKVEAQVPCSRFPCPYIVDCFTSRPAEKTIFLCFYFAVGVISAIASCAEFIYSSVKLICSSRERSPARRSQNMRQLEEAKEKLKGKTVSSRGSLRTISSKKVSSFGSNHRHGKYVSSKSLLV